MDSSSLHVLIIEDEQPIRRFLRASLIHESYRVTEATNGAEGIREATSSPPDLIILDLGLPDLDGQSVLNQLRDWFSGPIIILSARDQESQKILALDHGADDYVTKPFGIGELLARMRATLRHARKTNTDSTAFVFGEIRIDVSARLVYRNNAEVPVTPLEYKLLLTLAKHAGKVLTHRFLLREVWGPQSSEEVHYLRVFVASLRRKLEVDPARPRYLLTEQGVGYRLITDFSSDT